MKIIYTQIVTCCLIIGCFFMPSKAMNDFTQKELLAKFFDVIEKNDPKLLNSYFEEYSELVNKKRVSSFEDMTLQQGSFPLHVALEQGYYEVAKILLKIRALVTRENFYGNTPLLHAIKFMRVKSKTEGLKMIQLIIDSGASCDCINKKGKTPLLSLFSKSSEYVPLDAVKLLLENKANVNIQDNNKRTVLHFIARHEYFNDMDSSACLKAPINDELAQMFLKAGANSNVQNSFQETPLFIAILNNRFEMAKAFLEYEGDYRGDKDIECPLFPPYRYMSSTKLALSQGDVEFAKYMQIYAPNNIKGKFKEFENYKDFTISYANEHKRKFEELEN